MSFDFFFSFFFLLDSFTWVGEEGEEEEEEEEGEEDEEEDAGEEDDKEDIRACSFTKLVDVEDSLRKKETFLF